MKGAERYSRLILPARKPCCTDSVGVRTGPFRNLEVWSGDSGNLYGMTFSGGLLANDCITLGCGVVFKLDPKGKETVLYRFTGGKDGAGPQASVVRDSAGNLYGTTQGGGDLNCVPPYGCGTVFKLDKSGKLTVLHRLAGGDDGYHPLGGVTLDKAGNIYGTAAYGGVYGNGVVFKLTP
jgi:uncharacterized repeat protein (TIGR03803 family)